MAQATTAHSLHSLETAMHADLKSCNTETERANCRAICGREIRETAEQIATHRSLTDGERAIAQRYGYR